MWGQGECRRRICEPRRKIAQDRYIDRRNPPNERLVNIASDYLLTTLRVRNDSRRSFEVSPVDVERRTMRIVILTAVAFLWTRNPHSLRKPRPLVHLYNAPHGRERSLLCRCSIRQMRAIQSMQTVSQAQPIPQWHSRGGSIGSWLRFAMIDVDRFLPAQPSRLAGMVCKLNSVLGGRPVC